ncbi:MBL fold metallo-hydrolase [Emcibacter sp. SYSU 3D8]|uniref:MBL fold metallo-hydrolase n=1 Tax=Emcibacter sp. SYSU 3D8 TaxID=3133969 RepID=UPI0031FF08FF
MRITFLGAVGTVTGSKYLVRAGKARLLVDCGLFQGFKNLRLRNRAPLPLDPASLDAVILTHAHLDHSGYLPLLVRNGFHGPVLCTPGTADLCRILLPDSAMLQERDADFANRHGTSKHHPAQPLYTRKDAERALGQLRCMNYGEDARIGKGVTLRFDQAGHILGSALTRLTWKGTSLQFSGDLGRPESATLPAPATIEEADYLVVESTYGDRQHPHVDPETMLADVINRTSGRGGSVVIPAFAVGRTQTLLYHLARLKHEQRIPDLPIFLDSPMAINATETFERHPNEHKLTRKQCHEAFDVATYVRDPEDSKALDRSAMPMVLVSASGMATGGRVLHHLMHFAPDPRNTILFAGFQAGGTRGAAIVAGAREVKIFGNYVPVRAEVQNMDMFSAHADADEIMAWLGGFRRPPKMTFVTHGEPAAADALRHRIEEGLGWDCMVPDYKERYDLD